MTNVENIVKVMNFHSILRVDSAKKKANKIIKTEEELNKLIQNIYHNKNFNLDKKLIKSNVDGEIINIYIGNDLGFCGNFNTTINSTIMKDNESKKIIIGKKINDHISNIIFYTDKDDFLNEFNKIEEIIRNYFKEDKIKEINIIYNHYYNINSFDFTIKKVFPIDIKDNELDLSYDYILETDVNDILTRLIVLYICYEIRICECNSWAAENVMRQQVTKDALDRIEEITAEKNFEELKVKKDQDFQKQISTIINIEE